MQWPPPKRNITVRCFPVESLIDSNQKDPRSTKASVAIAAKQTKARIETQVFLNDLKELMNKKNLPSKRGESVNEFGDEFLRLEIESMPILFKLEEHCSVSVDNSAKNRYLNVLALDKTRVVLDVPIVAPQEETTTLPPPAALPASQKPRAKPKLSPTYINANYVAGTNGPRTYIATQCPMDNTIADFWQMIWQTRVNFIVMVTKLVEKGKKKGAKYWPDKMDNSDNVMEFYGDFQVTQVGEPEHFSHGVILRKCKLRKVKKRIKRNIYDEIQHELNKAQENTPSKSKRNSSQPHSSKKNADVQPTLVSTKRNPIKNINRPQPHSKNMQHDPSKIVPVQKLRRDVSKNPKDIQQDSLEKLQREPSKNTKDTQQEFLQKLQREPSKAAKDTQYGSAENLQQEPSKKIKDTQHDSVEKIQRELSKINNDTQQEFLQKLHREPSKQTKHIQRHSAEKPERAPSKKNLSQPNLSFQNTGESQLNQTNDSKWISNAKSNLSFYNNEDHATLDKAENLNFNDNIQSEFLDFHAVKSLFDSGDIATMHRNRSSTPNVKKALDSTSLLQKSAAGSSQPSLLQVAKESSLIKSTANSSQPSLHKANDKSTLNSSTSSRASPRNSPKNSRAKSTLKSGNSSRTFSHKTPDNSLQKSPLLSDNDEVGTNYAITDNDPLPPENKYNSSDSELSSEEEKELKRCSTSGRRFFLEDEEIEFYPHVHIVRHYQYTRWPDHEIPRNTKAVLDLMERIQNEEELAMMENIDEDCMDVVELEDGDELQFNDPELPPIVVHCSAGVGRTGVYIAADIALRRLKEQHERLMHQQSGRQIGEKFRPNDVMKLVRECRSQRLGMVQTWQQYRFIYYLILDGTLRNILKETIQYKELDNEYEEI